MLVQKSRKSLRKFPYNLMKGSLLEAKDVYNTWYPVKVLSIKDDKVHVHFCNWSSRYDTWYPLKSNCLRPLMLTKSRNKDSKASLCAPHPDRKHRDTSQYNMGTYVMAVWRNDYEYLAEVLAHRQRHGDRSEYRLRYIWDNVIEWTPASRLRKASLHEINFVLQFCRQHGSSHSARLTSGNSNLPSPKTENTSGSPKNNQVLTTRSNGKQIETVGATSNNCNGNNIHATKLPKPVVETKPETSLEQNDMVYDKAVLQFHEACRKRRELKRLAAMAANDLDTTVSTNLHVDSTGGTVPASQPRPDSSKTTSMHSSGSKKRKPSDDIDGCHSVENQHSPLRLTSSPNSEVKPAPQAKRRHISSVSGAVMERPASPQQTEAQRSSSSNATGGTVAKVEIPSPGTLVLRISKQQCVPAVTRNSLVVTVGNSRPPLAKSPKTDVGKSGLTGGGSGSTEPSDVAVAAPIVHPCPYCPRRLRHAKLLTAHIANYHKAQADSEANHNSTPQCSDGNLRPIQSANDDRHPQQSQYPPTVDDRLSSTDSKVPRHLLACHRCGAYCHVSSNETEGLLQCQSCLCWVHKTCYRPPLDGGNDDSGLAQAFICCDGCLRASERVRSSRRNECYLSCNSNRPETSTGVNCQQHLIADASELLDWTHRLTPLLRTGWTLLNNTKLPSPTAAKAPPVSLASAAVVFGRRDKKQPFQSSTLDGLSTFSTTGHESPVKRLVDLPVTLESCGNSVTGCQPTVSDGFFMEFENTPSLDPAILPFPGQPDSEVIPVRSLGIRVPLSAVANSADPGFWRAIGDDEADGEDETTVSDSNDALTGFLQDLGPNVLPDLDGMVVDYLTPTGDPSCPRPTVLPNGQDNDDEDLLSAVVQPHVASILDTTPMKEALKEAENLLAPVPATIVSSVLQAGAAVVVATGESRSDLVYQQQSHPSGIADGPALSSRSPPGRAEFLGDVPHRDDVVNLSLSEGVPEEPFSTSQDLLAIVPFRDSLEEEAGAFPLHTLTTVVSGPGKSPIEGTCYAGAADQQETTRLSTSGDCAHSLMGSLQVSELDWIATSVGSVCTAAVAAAAAASRQVSPDTVPPGVPGTIDPLYEVNAGGTSKETAAGDDVDDHFGFLPIEARGRPAAPALAGGEDQEEGDEDYLDRGWILANHKVNQNLDDLDQFILGPLERAITVVEAQLEQISTQLFVGASSDGRCSS